MIMGYGTSNGVEIHVQDKKGGNVEDLKKYTQAFSGALMERPEINLAYTTFEIQIPPI